MSSKDPGLRRGDVTKKPSPIVAVGVALLAIAGCNAVPQGKAEANPYVAQAQRMADVLNAGGVLVATIEKGGQIDVNEAQSGVRGLIGVIQPIALGPNAYAFFDSTTPDGRLVPHVVNTDASVKPLPAPGQLKPASPIPGPAPVEAIEELVTACDTYAVAGSTTDPQVPEARATYCTAALGSVPGVHLDQSTVVAAAGNYGGM